MAFAAGITRYQKKKWLDALVAAGMKIAFYLTTTGLDANQDPATPLAYTATGELSDSGTGYTTTGYTVANAVVSANGNAYQIDFDDIVTGSGTIASGTYGAMIYAPSDTNRAIAICQVDVSQGSSSGAMTFTIPVDTLKLT
jgi:hypothetical protein